MFCNPNYLACSKKYWGSPSVLSVHFKSGTLSSLDYSTTNQVDNKDLCIGFLTKQTVTRLHEEGDISDTQFRNFFEAVRKFLVGAAITYLDGALLKMTCWCMLPGLILNRGYRRIFLQWSILCIDFQMHLTI